MTEMQENSLPTTNKKDIKVLLLEGLNKTGVDILMNAGYQVECQPKALEVEVLKKKIKDVHAIGIRSKTQLTADVLACAKNLRVIGCFCIGTNQVDLQYAANHGITVFNSPFSNSRSVAELVISLMIALSRQVGDRNTEMHQGIWNKNTGSSREIKGKSLGIIGYGHIGSQLSVLANAFGMKIYFFDISQKLPLGTATPVSTLEELLEKVDFVSLHVPETPETKNMFGKREFAMMKKGSIFINASRGTVVDLDALASALKSGHLAGSAVDVYPVEPFKNGPSFKTVLQGCPNTILSPHIGGSTEEAQSAIGVEVGNALVRFLKTGSTLGCVNFPEVELRLTPRKNELKLRVINAHQNVPGVLRQINKIISLFNIEKQVCSSKGSIGYLIVDIDTNDQEEIRKMYEQLKSIPESILTRVIL